MKPWTIAIDFDDTITEVSPYPITGDIRPEAKLAISVLSDCNYRLVLWTSRTGTAFKQAVDRLKQDDLYDMFDWDYLDQYKSNPDCRGSKIRADFYIDDRAMMLGTEEEISWKEIVSYIRRKFPTNP